MDIPKLGFPTYCIIPIIADTIIAKNGQLKQTVLFGLVYIYLTTNAVDHKQLSAFTSWSGTTMEE